MNTAISPPHHHFTPMTLPDSGTLHVAAIYHNFAAGIRVRETLDLLVRSLAPMKVISKAWSFDMLTRLDVRAAAVREVEKADLLMIAGDGERMPEQIKHWLERCMSENYSRPTALVALHDDDLYYDEAALPLSCELRQTANRWNLNFISNTQFDDWLNSDYVPYVASRSQTPLHFANEFQTGRMAGAYSQPKRERLAV